MVLFGNSFKSAPSENSSEILSSLLSSRVSSPAFQDPPNPLTTSQNWGSGFHTALSGRSFSIWTPCVLLELTGVTLYPTVQISLNMSLPKIDSSCSKTPRCFFLDTLQSEYKWKTVCITTLLDNLLAQRSKSCLVYTAESSMLEHISELSRAALIGSMTRGGLGEEKLNTAISGSCCKGS